VSLVKEGIDRVLHHHADTKRMSTTLLGYCYNVGSGTFVNIYIFIYIYIYIYTDIY